MVKLSDLQDYNRDQTAKEKLEAIKAYFKYKPLKEKQDSELVGEFIDDILSMTLHDPNTINSIINFIITKHQEQTILLKN